MAIESARWEVAPCPIAMPPGAVCWTTAPLPMPTPLSPLTTVFGPMATDSAPTASESAASEFAWKYLIGVTVKEVSAPVSWRSVTASLSCVPSATLVICRKLVPLPTDTAPSSVLSVVLYGISALLAMICPLVGAMARSDRDALKRRDRRRCGTADIRSSRAVRARRDHAAAGRLRQNRKRHQRADGETHGGLPECPLAPRRLATAGLQF